ncbi:tetratricopeptide repeat protein [Priestia megaterium]|uniref:tetratricopeptide repeat protein n=1 Tax=Priestia megaterium TaxID=1404 RepID=UPI002E1F9740|nr:tetratricopeptide repeat protein [Priestia megaterium]MED3971312.1 tetratricopeptide repeat protein [Priestia megaterium]
MICKICNENKVNFSCEVINYGICIDCCNDFQTCKTKKWGTLIDLDSDCSIDKLSDKCLQCKGLVRESIDNIKAGTIFSFTYNNKSVFYGMLNKVFFNKKRVLLEQIIDKNDITDVYHLAECYWELGETKKGIEILESVIDQNIFKEVSLLLGMLYKNDGNLSESEINLLKSIEIDSKYSKAYRELADLYSRKEEHIKSIFYHDKALEHLGNDDSGGINDSAFDINYIGLSVSYSKIKQYDKTIEYAQAYLNDKPTWEQFETRVKEQMSGKVNYMNIDFEIYAHSTLYHLIALSYLELNNLDLAEEYIDRALTLDKNSPDFNKLKGIIIGLRRGKGQIVQYEEQLQILKQSAELRASSFSKLKSLSPKDQVNFFTGDENESVQSFLVKKIFNVLRAVLGISHTVTHSDGNPAEEDSYTDLFKSHMDASLLETLGWTTNTQSRGGFTRIGVSKRGGVGERDLVIRSQEGTDLLIGEALILKGAHSTNIKKHTEKIFGYDITSCNFHLIINWGFANDPDRVWEEYKNLVSLKNDGPFPVLEIGTIEELLPSINANGLRTFYTIHSTDWKDRNATVIHVYIDLKNGDKRTIADTARKY